jgi:sugar/nucleoside kinase (ribokinase family)
MRIGVLGMATVDTLLTAPNPSYAHDTVTVLDGMSTSIGGKGIATAISAHHAGAEVLPFALVGMQSMVVTRLAPIFDGRCLIRALDEDHRTWIVISALHEVVTFVRDLAPAPALLDSVRDSVRAFAEQIDLLYLSMENPVVIDAAIQAARVGGLPLVSNLCAPLTTRAPELVPLIVRASHTIICNETESAAALAALGISEWRSAEAPLLEDVILTGGSAGGRWSHRPFTAWTTYDPVPVGVVCVVGAGDAFNGQYITSRFVRGDTTDQACAAGAARASEKVAVFASSLPIATLRTRSA